MMSRLCCDVGAGIPGAASTAGGAVYRLSCTGRGNILASEGRAARKPPPPPAEAGHWPSCCCSSSCAARGSMRTEVHCSSLQDEAMEEVARENSEAASAAAGGPLGGPGGRAADAIPPRRRLVGPGLPGVTPPARRQCCLRACCWRMARVDEPLTAQAAAPPPAGREAAAEPSFASVRCPFRAARVALLLFAPTGCC